MPPRSIVFVTSHFRGLGGYGGQRSRIFAESLADFDVNVQVVCPGVDTLTGERIVEPGVSSSARLEVKYLPTLPFNRRIFVTRIVSQIFSSVASLFIPVKRDALYVLNNNPPIVYLLFGMKLLLTGGKYVLDVRDFPFHKYYHQRPILSWPIRLIDSLIIRRRAGSISVSDGFPRALGLHREADVVIRLGCDDVAFAEPSERTVDLKDARFVYVGSINSYFCVEAFLAELAGMGFTGEFHYYGKSPCLGLAEKYPFFRHMGTLSKGELVSALSSYDCGLFPIVDAPYTEYLLGNKVFDYIAASLPICVFGSTGSDASRFAERHRIGGNWLDLRRQGAWRFSAEAFMAAQQQYKNMQTRHDMQRYFEKQIGVSSGDGLA